MSSNPEESSPSGSKRDSQLLSPIEAAHLLGVTPELLFAYARYAPKKNLGHERTLPYVTDQGYDGFRQFDLESFDAYLSESWSESSTDRPAIPTYIVDYLKVECGAQCARCGKGYKLENAHINPYADTRSHHHHNLIRLCSECHEKYDAQPTSLISREEIQTLKDQLVAKVRQRLHQNVKTGYARIGRMPNPASQFVGREHEIGILVEALHSSRSISIQGAGGIGKTQLLLNALQRISDERSVLWINVEAYSSVSDLELALATSLSKEGLSIPANAVVDVLVDAEVRVIFDGVERMSPSDMDDLEDFFGNLLTMTSTPQFIFTSQAELNELDINVRLRVDPLDEASGILILRSALDFDQLETSDAERQLRWLESFCEGHPLSLRLTAGLLRYFKSASAVVNRIIQNGASVLQNPTRKRQSTSTSLRSCLLVSYQTLTVNQRRILWLSSQCPAGFWIQIIKEGRGYEIDNLDGDLAALQRWHLLDIYTDALDRSRLYVLSPIRAFVETELEIAAPKDVEKLRYILVENLATQAMVLNFEHVQGGNAEFGLFRFDQEFPNFIKILHLAVNNARTDERYLDFVITIASSLQVYCFVRGLFERGIQIMRLGAGTAAQLKRKRAASVFLLQMLVLGKRSFNSEIVLSAASELATLAEGSKEVFLLANAATAKGEVALMLGQLDEAADCFASATLHYKADIQAAKSTHNIEAENRLKGKTLDRDSSALHMLAMSLKQQGYVFEIGERPIEAISFYEQALLIVRGKNDEINIGPILHGIGNCATAASQFNYAFESYLAAAKQFYLIGSTEFLSNSLAELGYLLVSWDSPAPIDSLISGELLTNGLLDTTKQIASILISSSAEFPSNSVGQIIRKTFGIVILSSFTSYNWLLGGWANSLQQDILRPYTSQLQQNQHRNESAVPLAYLDCIIVALAMPLATIEQPLGMGRLPVLEEVSYFARICYRYFNVDWMSHYSFEWLATYLRRHRGLHNISSTELRAAAKASEETGLPFSISGL